MHSGKPVVITDLDGTLLDRETYGYGTAIPALRPTTIQRPGAGRSRLPPA